MYDNKPWYASKTILGGMIALVAGAAGAFGIAISPEDQEMITQGVLAVGSAIGGLLAIYGRIRATGRIK